MKISIEKEYYYCQLQRNKSDRLSHKATLAALLIYTLPWDNFKEILQELLKAEMDESLGYEKTKRGILKQAAKETAIPQRPLRANMGNSRLMCPGIGMANSSRS